MLGLATAILLQGTIEFKPGLYTFPEIAQRLSTPDRTIHLAVPIRGSAAMLALKPRSVEAARGVLCDAFDLVLEKQGERWTLVRNPEIVKRDLRRQQAFVADLDYLAQKQADIYRAARKELLALEKQGLPVPDRAPQNLHLMNDAHVGVPTFLAAENLPRLTTSILWQPYVVSRPKTSINRERLERWSYLVSVTGSIPEPRIRYLIQGLMLRARVTVPDGSGGERPADGVFAVQVVGDSPTDAVYLGSKTSSPVPNRGLGEVDAKWLTTAKQAKEKVISTLPGNQQPFKRAADSISMAVESWVERTGGEAAIELCPAQEGITAGDTLTSAFQAGPWIPEIRSGVLTATHPLSFLRRPDARLLPALVELIRDTKGATWRSVGKVGPLSETERPVKWSALGKFYSAIFKGNDPHAFRNELSGAAGVYHRLNLWELINNVGVSYLYSLLPPIEKKRLFASETGSASYALSEFAPAARLFFFRSVFSPNPEVGSPMSLNIRWTKGSNPKERFVSLFLHTGEGPLGEIPEGVHFPWLFSDSL